MTDKTMTLEPCPWCGEPMASVSVSEGSTFRWRKVDGCCADGPEVRHDTMDDDQEAAEVDSRRRAIEAWNTRHLSQPAERGEVQEKAEPVARIRKTHTLLDVESYAEVAWKLPNGTHELYTAPPPAAGVPDVDRLRRAIAILREEDDSEAPVDIERKAGWRAALDAVEGEWLYTAPSPTIDVAAVREVIGELRGTSAMLQSELMDSADKLARAIGDAK